MKEEAEEEGGPGQNELWNAQPFRPPPSLPVPACKEGCARAQGIADGLKRIGHGTGGSLLLGEGRGVQQWV